MNAFRWEDKDGNAGWVRTVESSIAIDIADCLGYTSHRITPEDARTLAGALLAAAQRIDPLPSTTPTPALTPDRLT